MLPLANVVAALGRSESLSAEAAQPNSYNQTRRCSREAQQQIVRLVLLLRWEQNSGCRPLRHLSRMGSVQAQLTWLAFWPRGLLPESS